MEPTNNYLLLTATPTPKPPTLPGKSIYEQLTVRQSFPHPLCLIIFLLGADLCARAKVLSNNTNKPGIVLRFLMEALGRRAPGVDPTPLIPDSEGFIAPSPKTDFFDDSWCDDFLSAEHTPCDSVDIVRIHFDGLCV